MSVCKDYMFRVGAIPRPHGTVRIISGDRPALEVATPVEFRQGLPGYWSPEDMLVGAVASCYALTFRALASRRAVPFVELEVSGAGHVTRRADGRFGFVLVELKVTVATDVEHTEAIEEVARAAERQCIIGRALDVPIELELDVRTHASAFDRAPA
jgi:organic hydroperoxide reductase OsmC/OhrA